MLYFFLQFYYVKARNISFAVYLKKKNLKDTLILTSNQEFSHFSQNVCDE